MFRIIYSKNAVDGFKEILSDMPEKYWIKMNGSYRYPVYSGWKKGLQIQQDLHILYARGGEGYYYMDDGAVIPLKRGSLVFISNRYPHRASHNKNNPLVISGLRFDLNDHLGNSVLGNLKNAFYFYEHMYDNKHYDDITKKIHLIFHGEYDLQTKKTCPLLVHQILNDMYLMTQKEISDNSEYMTKIQKAKQYIEEHSHEKVSVKDIAENCDLSIRYLQKLFKNKLGFTPKEYHLNIQMDTAYKFLQELNMSVKEVADYLGYSDQYAFSHQFKKHFGISPISIKRKD